MNITPCVCCAWNTAFGPAEIVWVDPDDGVETVTRYCNCKRCGAMLVLGRDVVEEAERGE